MTDPDRPALVVACDLSDAPDTGPERLAEYARLLDAAFVSRSRTAGAMIWRLRTGPGIEAWARDLAARENACCGFMTHTVRVDAGHVVWHATTIDDPSARAVLDLFYDLPVTRPDTVEAAGRRWQELAVPVLIREGPNGPGDGAEPTLGESERAGGMSS